MTFTIKMFRFELTISELIHWAVLALYLLLRCIFWCYFKARSKQANTDLPATISTVSTRNQPNISTVITLAGNDHNNICLPMSNQMSFMKFFDYFLRFLVILYFFWF